MTRLAFAFGFALVLSAFAGTASAQYRPPAGPTLPIELDFFRPQQGVLDNYNQFVAPRHALANQLRTMETQQATDRRVLGQRINELDRMRASQAAPTGTSATFMNYSHYFNRFGAGGGGRRR